MVNLATVPLTVYEHMAVDDVLAAAPYRGPVLRFYNWKDGVAATFGYAQFYGQVIKQFEPLGISAFTRRPTGGGVVLHDGDLTFSLIFEEHQNLRPTTIYNALHGHIQAAFAQHGCLQQYNKQANYSPSIDGAASACFANPVADDLLGPDGQKVLGGAIRRYGVLVLYQGSLRLPSARGNGQYMALLKQAVSAFCNEVVEDGFIDASLLKQACSLAQSQYAKQEWVGRF